MAMVKKSITVTEQQDSWIKIQIETGHYGNESEVVRELIRERQLREQGYVVAPSVLDQDILRRVRHACDTALDALTPEQCRRRNVAQAA